MGERYGLTVTLYFELLLIQQAAAFSSSSPLYVSPVPLVVQRKVTSLSPLCPLILLVDISWKRLLCCRTLKVRCSAGEKVSGNNTEHLSSSLLLNVMSFKWDLRIAMLFESFPHKGGKRSNLFRGSTQKETLHTPTPKGKLLSFLFHCQAFRLSRAGEHRAHPPIHPALFETAHTQQLQKHLPVV